MPVLDCATGLVREHTPEELAAIAAELSVSPVPTAVSAAQLKLALLGADLLDNVDAFAAAQPREAQIRWEYSTEFRRDHPMLNAMADAYGLTAAEVDDLFRQAATL